MQKLPHSGLVACRAAVLILVDSIFLFHMMDYLGLFGAKRFCETTVAANIRGRDRALLDFIEDPWIVMGTGGGTNDFPWTVFHRRNDHSALTTFYTGCIAVIITCPGRK